MELAELIMQFYSSVCEKKADEKFSISFFQIKLSVFLWSCFEILNEVIKISAA